MFHFHTHGPTLTGFVHGAAGALAVIALVPLAHSTTTALLAVAAFGLGSLLAMGLFGLVAARLYQGAAAARRQMLYRGAVGATSLAGLILGVVWVSRVV